jgi:hypothetical protein
VIEERSSKETQREGEEAQQAHYRGGEEGRERTPGG